MNPLKSSLGVAIVFLGLPMLLTGCDGIKTFFSDSNEQAPYYDEEPVKVKTYPVTKPVIREQTAPMKATDSDPAITPQPAAEQPAAKSATPAVPYAGPVIPSVAPSVGQ